MRKKVVILGAGINGLAACYFLQKKFPLIDITLIEKNSFVGGLLQSESNEGKIFEHAANGFLSSYKEFLNLIKELNLGGELIEQNKSSTKRLIANNHKLIPLPNSTIKFIFFPTTQL